MEVFIVIVIIYYSSFIITIIIIPLRCKRTAARRVAGLIVLTAAVLRLLHDVRSENTYGSAAAASRSLSHGRVVVEVWTGTRRCFMSHDTRRY